MHSATGQISLQSIATADKLDSCLTSAAGHQLDVLVGSVLQQLSVQGWGNSLLAISFPGSIPTTTSFHQARPRPLELGGYAVCPR